MLQDAFNTPPAGQSAADGTNSQPAVIDVEVARTFEQIQNVSNDWDAFMLARECEIFWTYDWCRLWWNCYGGNRTLQIILCRVSGRLVGILPFFLETHFVRPFSVTVAQWVGTDHSPVTVSVPIDWEFAAEISDAVVETLDACGVQLVIIGDIAGKDACAGALFSLLQSSAVSPYTASVRQTDVQTYFRVAPTWELQVSGLSKQERKRMRRAYREIDRNGLELESQVATDRTFDAFFEGFVRMHQAYWESHKNTGHFGAWPHSLDFHRSLAQAQLQQHRLRLLQIKLAGQIVGYKYAYRFGGLCTGYLDARAPDELPHGVSFARLGFGELVRRLQQEKGVSLYDSMRGDYEHKRHLGGELLPVHRILLTKAVFSSRVLICALRLYATVLDLLCVRVWRRRLAPKLGIRPRPFPRAWLRLERVGYPRPGSRPPKGANPS